MKTTSPRVAFVTASVLLIAAVESSCSAFPAPFGAGRLNGSAIAPLGFNTNGPATIGMVFRQSELPSHAHVVSTNGKNTQAQIDPLVHWPNGSLKFARITVMHAGQYVVMPGKTAKTPEPAAPHDRMAIPDFRIKVDTSHGTLTQSLRQMQFQRQACGRLLCILSFSATPLVSVTTGAMVPNLALRAWVWDYPTLGTSEIVATLENTWAQTVVSNTATRNIQFLLNGKSVYQERGVTIWRWSRTRPIRVWTGVKVSDHADRNLSYLRSTGAVPNYDPNLELAKGILSRIQKRYERRPKGLMGSTLVTRYMPTTGGRPDIGPIPRWDTFAVLTNNPLAQRIAQEVDDSSAVWPVHLRSKTTGQPFLPERYPNAFALSRRIRGNPIPCWESNCKIRYPKTHIPLTPGIAHEPGMDYVPYLLTADPYYLEELEFWNSWNALTRNPGLRHGSKIIFVSAHNQARSIAWQLRTLGDLLFVLPEHSPEYKYWRSVLQYNRNSVIQNWVGKKRLPIPVIPTLYGIGIMAPGQQDFLTWAFGNTVRLGFHDWEPIVRWNTEFVVRRLTDSGVCPELASLYNVKYYYRSGNADEQWPNYRNGNAVGQWPAILRATVADKKFKWPSNLLSLPCNSRALADALHVPRPGDFAGYPASPQGFVAHMQPAIAAAVDAGVPGAKKAWRIYQGRPTKQNYSRYPVWDIVPSQNAR